MEQKDYRWVPANKPVLMIYRSFVFRPDKQAFLCQDMSTKFTQPKMLKSHL